MISADELSSIQATVEDTLEETCIRRRYAEGAADVFGNPAVGAATDVTYDCRKVPAPGNETTVDRDVQTHEASFLLPHDADVIGSDVLIHDSVTWQVLGPATDQSWPTHLRVIARRTEAL